MRSDFSRRSLLVLCVGVLLPEAALADGSTADKIYHPYVQALERELEWRAVLEQDREGADSLLWRLGYGRSLSDNWSVEGYVAAERVGGESWSVASYELESQWQITEQGEYAADWGMLFELEREHRQDIWEASTVLLVERQWGAWVGTANIRATYEWGDDILDELETGLALQGRYRWSSAWEPALELHLAEDLVAAGPAVLGLLRLRDGTKLRWETGLAVGLSEESPNLIWRALLEWEF